MVYRLARYINNEHIIKVRGPFAKRYSDANFKSNLLG